MTITKIPQSQKNTIPQSLPVIAPHIFEDAVQQTGLHGKKPLKVIAPILKISYWHLAHGISARPLQLSCRYLIGLMREGGPDPILRFLAKEFEYTILPPSEDVQSPLLELFEVSDSWMAFTAIAQKYLRKQNNPDDILSSVDKLITGLLRMKTAVVNNKKRGRR